MCGFGGKMRNPEMQADGEAINWHGNLGLSRAHDSALSIHIFFPFIVSHAVSS